MMATSGFELVEEREIPELNTKARWFRHQATGAELLSLENADENKVFGITFRTPPPDSTGVPHIMEHSVLNGSQKYPVKEPFVELVKGSLNTFLNAMTYNDRTCYPVASQNVKDFYNLIDVYMDAVLHPLIAPQTLDQEGWHYELDQVDAPLAYKGVVFNEMKGYYSSTDTLVGELSRQSLFPDNAYGLDPGGDPRAIPDLTYDQFKNFHTTYYHPSNAMIFFYGDDDPQERLRLMDVYLEGYDQHPVDAGVVLQAPFTGARQIRTPYDAGEAESGNKGMVTLNWLLGETLDSARMLAFTILNHILTGTPAAPLRKALIDSGLGEDLVGIGLDDEVRQAYFSTGLKGILVEDSGKVEKLILDTLEKLAQEGIDPGTVAASVNTIEFQLRENNTGSFPRGLLLMLRALTTWTYGGDPVSPLAFEEPLEALKSRLAQGEHVFEQLIQDLLANPHRTTVIFEPDPEFGRKRDEEEQARLEKARLSFSPETLQELVEKTRQLKLRQETPDTPEALATIPSLKLEDLDRVNKVIPLEVLTEAGCQVLYHDLPTNGIVYLDLGFNLHALAQEDLPYLPLFSRTLLEMGTETEDFVRLSQRIGRSTGGIRPTSFTSAMRTRPQSAAWMFLRGKATTGKAGELLAILRDVLLTGRLDDRERFRQMALEEKADQEAGLVPAGHRVVNSRLRARFGEAGWAAEQMGGVSYLLFLRRLVDQIETDWAAVQARLEAIRSALLDRANMLCNVTVNLESWKEFNPRLVEFLSGLPTGTTSQAVWVPAFEARPEGLTIPAPVNYVGKAANLYALGYELDGSVNVVLNYLRTTYLWEKVRVQGGAYGAMAIFDHRSGVLSMLSYRDPNVIGTVENFDLAGEFLRRLEITPDELLKSIIGTIGDLDAYQLPDAKGYTSMLRYLAGDTDAERQIWREQVLDAGPQDFQAFGEVLQRMQAEGQVAVLGSADAIRSANEARPGWLAVVKVL